MIPKTTFHAVRREGGGGKPMTQSRRGKSERQEVPGRDSVIGETYRKKSVSIRGKPKVGCPDLDLWELLATYDK